MSDPGKSVDTRPAGGAAGGAASQLIESLVCPASGTRLEWDPKRQELLSRAAGLAYPVRDGIPIMLIDEARKLDA